MGVGESRWRAHDLPSPFITFVALGVIVLGLPVVLTVYAQLSGHSSTR